MADANNMIDIAESELEKLVGKYASCVRKAKQTVICEDSSQTHGPSMQYGLVTQATETSVPVYYLDSFTNSNVAEDGEEGEDGRECRLAIDNEERDVVDFKAVCEVPYTCPASIGVSDDNHLVAPINKFLELVRTGCVAVACGRPYAGQLVHVALHPSCSL
jgi:hypothetical protein